MKGLNENSLLNYNFLDSMFCLNWLANTFAKFQCFIIFYLDFLIVSVLKSNKIYSFVLQSSNLKISLSMSLFSFSKSKLKIYE